MQDAEAYGRGEVSTARQRNRISWAADSRVQVAALHHNAQLPGSPALPDAPQNKAPAPSKQQPAEKGSVDIEIDQKAAQQCRQDGKKLSTGDEIAPGTTTNCSKAAKVHQKQKHAGKSDSSSDKAQLSNHDVFVAMFAIVIPLTREMTALNLKPNTPLDESVQQRVARTLKEVKPHWKDLKRAAKGKGRRRTTAAAEPTHKPSQAAALTGSSNQPAQPSQAAAQGSNPSRGNVVDTGMATSHVPLHHAKASAAILDPTAVVAAGEAPLHVGGKQHEASGLSAEAGAPGLDKLVDGVPAAGEASADMDGSRPAGPAEAAIPDNATNGLAKPANGEPGLSCCIKLFNCHDLPPGA